MSSKESFEEKVLTLSELDIVTRKLDNRTLVLYIVKLHAWLI